MFVRKTSRDRQYNPRLEAQAKKQKDFTGSYASVPEIYGSGLTEEGLYYFDMEYIRGITLAEYMKTIQVSSISGITSSIITSLTDSPEYPADISVFGSKIASLKTQLDGMYNDTLTRALCVLENHSWDKFYSSPCHGDMTLENILFSDGRLYLIDFLDSFYDCWLMDAAAVMQDVQVMWSYRNESQDINTAIRLMIFRDIMLDILEHKAGADCVNEIYYALLLKLVRIYPYTSDTNTLDFLNHKTELILRQIS